MKVLYADTIPQVFYTIYPVGKKRNVLQKIWIKQTHPISVQQSLPQVKKASLAWQMKTQAFWFVYWRLKM